MPCVLHLNTRRDALFCTMYPNVVGGAVGTVYYIIAETTDAADLLYDHPDQMMQ